MAFDFSLFGGGDLGEMFVEWLVNERCFDQLMRYEKLWAYYRNDQREVSGLVGDPVSESSRPYYQAQEYGLPSRITGVNHSFYGGILGGETVRGVRRKEVVVENDVAWRVSMVDFLFGKPIVIVSAVKDAERAEEIQQILKSVFDANGGVNYFQELALLGSVYGFVDVVLRWDGVRGDHSALQGDERATAFGQVLSKAKRLGLEAIEAPRSVPILDENNFRKINYYIQHYWQEHNRLNDDDGIIDTLDRHGRRIGRQKETHNVEVLGRDYWQRYEDSHLVSQGVNPLGVVPVVHIQNMPLPSHYEGQSDVESLIPLQDELNTRLSDRANRITFQSFKMYLGKGIEGFEDRVVSPGRMWSTENPEACIEEFGGDPGSPSEESHINHVREALDKASGVASIAAGILKGRIGNLTSAVALKMTLMGVLSKTDRKRVTYGRGIADISRLILLALDKFRIYRTSEEERDVQIHWPSPLPENLLEKLEEAKLKQELGVPTEQIMKELGYTQQQA